MEPAARWAKSRVAWPIALVGLGLVVFAVVGLSGPGRIDSVEGQTRFEVGRSLVEHGDSVLRDSRIVWNRFPGRDGNDYSYDRLPPSVAATAAIKLADATGPVEEGRRHFFFVQSGAAACGLLSILYAIWFRRVGCGPNAALLWAAGGVFCTPVWYAGTSTFGDSLGATTVVGAMAAAGSRSLAGALGSGALLGLAWNCDPALAVFALLALAIQDDRAASAGARFQRAAIIVAGLLAGIGLDLAYDRYKFPFDKAAAHAEQLAAYGPNLGPGPIAAFAVLTVSLGAGAFWYFPPLVVCLRGVAAGWTSDRRRGAVLVIAAVVFVGWICLLSGFKGDPCWGPRRLTPLFAVLWLFAPAGARRMRPWPTRLLLGFGVVVQVLGLAVDPHRLYVEIDVPSGFGRNQPRRYFEPRRSHLLNRPREIIEIAREEEPPVWFTPSPSPTFGFPMLEPTPRQDGDDPLQPLPAQASQRLQQFGPDVVRQYRVLNSFRPWWCSMRWLPAEDRPIPIGRTAAVLLGMAAAGLLMLAAAAPRPVSHAASP